jgi:hypothetical protein
MYECKECYEIATKEANGNEEIGHLSYMFTHYEFQHLTAEEKAELYGLPIKAGN